MTVSPTDAKNLLVLLERIQMSAKEVDVYVDLRARLRVAAHSSPVEPTKE